MPCALPLVIGITGHRHIADGCRTDIIRGVETAICELKALAGEETPLVLLSMLAQGADCIVAEAAINLGIQLIVALPMCKTLYITDFETLSARRHFEDLLLRADSTFVIPTEPGVCEQDIALAGDERNRQYRRTGEFIARHSHLLIALWDGRSSKGKGGTAEIVEFALGYRPVDAAVKDEDVLKLPPARKIIHIQTTRADGPDSLDAFPHGCIFSSGTLEATWNGLVSDVCAYNRRLQRRHKKLRSNIRRSVEGIRNPSHDEGIEGLRRHFGVADAMAVDLKRISRMIFHVYFWSLLFSGGSLMLFYKAGLSSQWSSRVILPIYLIAILTAAGAYWYGRKTKIKNKSIDCRTLAEGLRVQIFWRLSGLTDHASDYYMHVQREELSWVRFVLNGLNGTVSPTLPASDLELVCREWVSQQAGYYHHSAEKQGRLLRRLNRLVTAALALGILYVPFRALSVPLYARLKDHPAGHMALVYFTIIVGFSLSLWGSLKAYISFTGLGEQVSRYHTFRELFVHSEKRLGDCRQIGDTHNAKRILRLLGQETLAEHAGWLLLHRSKQLRFPK